MEVDLYLDVASVALTNFNNPRELAASPIDIYLDVPDTVTVPVVASYSIPSYVPDNIPPSSTG